MNIKDLFRNYKDNLNKKITINGWIKTIRSSKNFGFIEINDGSFFNNIQVVFDDNLINFKEISKFTIYSSISVEGVVVESEGTKQNFEIKASNIILLNLCDPEYPLQKKRHSFEYLRTIAHLRPRTNTFSAVFRIRSLASFAIHSFFQSQNFVYVHTPIITASDCEGAGQMFKVSTLDYNSIPTNENGDIDYSKDFFGKETSLTVSGQLSVENYCMAFGNVYTFGPTFRAENSNTARHASEFWMIEPEMAFCDINKNMDIAEEMIKYIIDFVFKNAKEEIEFFNKFIDKKLISKLENVLNSNFKRITYDKAIEILENSKQKFQFPAKWGNDLQTEHEKYLTEVHFKKPVFVTNYPKDIKAFYMKNNKDNKTVAAMDLLVPGIGEIIGGSQREENLETLEERMNELGLNTKDYWWYLDLRRYGSVIHSGFGLGFERMIMYLTGMENIRDVIPFPRTPKHADF